MAKDLEDQFENLMREGDREDVLYAMQRYSWFCKGRGMTPEQIKAEFDSLVARIMQRLNRRTKR